MKKIFTEENFLLLKLEHKYDNYFFIKTISEEYILPEELIEKYIDDLDLNAIIKYQKLSLNFIRKNLNKFSVINLNALMRYQHLNSDIAKQILNLTSSITCWITAIKKYQFNEKYIVENMFNAKYDVMGYICRYQKLSNGFLKRHWKKIKSYKCQIELNVYISKNIKDKLKEL